MIKLLAILVFIIFGLYHRAHSFTSTTVCSIPLCERLTFVGNETTWEKLAERLSVDVRYLMMINVGHTVELRYNEYVCALHKRIDILNQIVSDPTHLFNEDVDAIEGEKLEWPAQWDVWIDYYKQFPRN